MVSVTSRRQAPPPTYCSRNRIGAHIPLKDPLLTFKGRVGVRMGYRHDGTQELLSDIGPPRRRGRLLRNVKGKSPLSPLAKGGTQYPGILESGQSSSPIKCRCRRGRVLFRKRKEAGLPVRGNGLLRKIFDCYLLSGGMYDNDGQTDQARPDTAGVLVPKLQL